MRIHLSAVLAPALAGAVALAAHAQQPAAPQPPVFRSDVQVVEVDVRVFDRDGRFVEGLSREDFELLEDGVAQQVQGVFLVGDAAAGTGAAPAAGAAGAAPDAGAARAVHARQTWIFVFDLNHLTPGAGFDRARAAVEEFIARRLGDGDVAGVVAGSKMVNNRLTSVREELVAAVRSVRPLTELRNLQVETTREWPRLVDEHEALQIANEDREALQRAVLRACTEDADACKAVPPDLAIREKARRLQRAMHLLSSQTLAALNALASGLAKMPGPKTVVFLSDGFVAAELETTLRTIVGQMGRSGGRVYAIDVRGLNRGRGAGIIDQASAVDEAGAFSQFDAREDGPNSLAVDTGGLMIRNENNIGRALDAIARDAGRYYVLGYTPANGNFDGKYRAIQVKVGRDDVRVRARRGYLALEPAKMLVPQPVAPAAREAAPSASLRDDSPPEAPEPDDEGAAPAITATGAVVPAPAGPSAGPRLRPDGAQRVEELAAGTTAGAGDLAKRGWDAYQRGDVEAALPAFTAAAAAPGVRPWVLYALGLSQVALARTVDAAATWERVRGMAPEFAPVYLDLADAYLQLSRPSDALAVLRDAEQRWPGDPDVHNAVGVIHVRRGALEEAVAAFTRATKAAPDDSLGYYNLGRAYQMRYARGGRYVTSQKRWVAPEEDRRLAMEHLRRAVEIGGPQAAQAAEALAVLGWSGR